MADKRNHDAADDMDLESQVAALKNDLGSVKSDLTSITQLLLRQGKDSAVAAKDDIERRLHETVDHGRKYVEERPLTTALAAFGVGILAGIMAARR